MKDKKEAQRSTIYNNMIKAKLSKPYCLGRIPDFNGANEAAKNLRTTVEWKMSQIIFTSPDTALIKVRENVMLDKKCLIMASPKILNGYIVLKLKDVINHEKEAATIKGAFMYGKRIDDLPQVDMVVEGSVAVDKYGGRLGKGGGYGDREIEFLRKNNSINTETPVVSTVHEIQIIEGVATEPHDQKLNMVVTPERILRI